jgi:hypothetical protein
VIARPRGLDALPHCVLPGLGPGIHAYVVRKAADARAKPGQDDCGSRFSPARPD